MQLLLMAKEMDKEEQDQGNNVPTTIPSSRTDEADYNRDHALATALQQQEREFEMLDTTESDESEADDEDGDGSYLPSADDLEGNFFTSQELADLEIVEEEEEDEDDEDEETEEEEEEEEEEELEEDSDIEMGEEDDIDPDELSYEDLVALGEIVGEENQGLSTEEILPALTPFICKSIPSNDGIDKCVICQMDYEEGEDLVSLRCEHPFHACCITQWLQIKKTCPICTKEAIKQKTE